MRRNKRQRRRVDGRRVGQRAMDKRKRASNFSLENHYIKTDQ